MSRPQFFETLDYVRGLLEEIFYRESPAEDTAYDAIATLDGAYEEIEKYLLRTGRKPKPQKIEKFKKRRIKR
jgi:hypothetical protein